MTRSSSHSQASVPQRPQRLSETLRSWLLHQGRRDAVASHLHVHPQTVRYRMGQLRELYGERLDDPETVFELLLALRAPSASTRRVSTDPSVDRPSTV